MKYILDKIKLLIFHPIRFFSIVFGVVRSRFDAKFINKDGYRFTTDLEIQTLRRYVSQAKIGFVEIGVLDGKTTKEIAQEAHVPIYGIDPIIPDSMNKSLIGHEKYIHENMAFYKDFHFIKDFSYNVVGKWQYKFDMIFVDGDHEYDAAKQDCEQWLPLLESGGILALHDSAPVTSMKGAFHGWPGPIRVANELKQDERVEFVESADSLSIFRKK